MKGDTVGTWEYTWEEATIPKSLLRFTIELTLSWRAERYIAAKTNCDPDDGHPAEGGGVYVEDATVTDIQVEYGEPVEGFPPTKIPLTHQSTGYWARRFEKEVETDPVFISQLRDHVAHQEE